MKKLPVIVIPGFLTSIWPRGASFQGLEKEGYEIILPPANFLFLCGIHVQATALSNFIDKILKEYNINKCNIIGVSMGGMVVLYYLHNLGGAKKIKTFISVCAPFHGTWKILPMALTFGSFFAPISWETLPTSPLLKELLNKNRPNNVGIYCIAGEKDKIVPTFSAHHPHANENILISGDHTDLCLTYNKKLLELISLLLKKNS